MIRKIRAAFVAQQVVKHGMFMAFLTPFMPPKSLHGNSRCARTAITPNYSTTVT